MQSLVSNLPRCFLSSNRLPRQAFDNFRAAARVHAVVTGKAIIRPAGDDGGESGGGDGPRLIHVEYKVSPSRRSRRLRVTAAAASPPPPRHRLPPAPFLRLQHVSVPTRLAASPVSLPHRVAHPAGPAESARPL
jgi:hypothetical protein